MKWFKHLSGSLNDSFVFELIERFGGDGYLVFFGTLELMADEFDINNPGISRFSVKKLTKNLQISVKKLKNIMNFISEKGRIIAEFDNEFVNLNCPRLKELTDIYTNRKHKENVRTNFEQTSNKLHAREEEVEVEEDNNKKESKKKNKKSEKKENVEKEKYLEFVYLAKVEYDRLVADYGKLIVDGKIEDLDNYIGSKGLQKSYIDHNRTIRAWLKRDGIEKTDSLGKKHEPTEQRVITTDPR